MVSDPLDPEALREALRGRRFGANLIVVAETGSTNAELRDLADAGAPDGTVVVAEHQTAGRGRAGRVWESPPGRGVLLSALTVPGPEHEHASLLSLAAGVAACEAAEAVADGVEARLKWPNDVMVGDGKAAGILVEGELVGGEFRFAIVGIGINANHAEGELPEGGTSLALEVGRAVDRHRLADALLVALEERVADIDDADRFLPAYRRRCATLGREVRVERRGGPLEGTALDVDTSGALVVAGASGVHTISIGDVIHLRMAGGGRT